MVVSVIVPSPRSWNFSVTGSCAVVPLVVSVPAVKLAFCTVRPVNAAWLTAVKFAGGWLTSCCIPDQSCLAQSDR